MHTRIGRLTTVLLIALSWFSLSPAGAQDNSLSSKLLGKWQNTNDYKGAAMIEITSVDPATGQLKGKYIPPAGPAKGTEFDVVGFVSSAAPAKNADNVITVSF